MGTAAQDYFDGVAGKYYSRNYETPRTRHEHVLALRRAVCLELVGDAGPRVLDVGCGPGALAVPLFHAGREVVALDLSPGMVASAKARIGDSSRAGFVVANATALPFATGSFDVVVTTGALEYVPDLQRAVDEIARVLRPGGILVGTVSLPRTLERQFGRVAGPILERIRTGKTSERLYHRGISAAEFDGRVAQAGLALVDRRFSAFAPFPLDMVLPRAVPLIDRHLGRYLAKSELATSQAKTYIVKARKP